jgi:OOP family OmpA-OmpF porin
VKTYTSYETGIKSTSGQYDSATAHYISRDGYASTPQTAVMTAPPEKQAADLPLVIEVTDVLFDFDKWVIKKPFVPELKQWADYFKNNPQVKANIYGHTDSTGTTTYNEGLSSKRAQAVVNFLVEAGVASNRLTAKGFGEIQPVSTNTTKEGRQKNRRVELDL